MGVRSEHRRYSSFKVPAKRNLLRRGFSVEVHQDYFGRDLLEQLVGIAKWVVVAGHKHTALKVDDAIGDAAARAALVPAEARGTHWIVCRPQDAARQGRLISVGGVQVLDDLALVPDVVAGGDDVDAELEQRSEEHTSELQSLRDL